LSYPPDTVFFLLFGATAPLPAVGQGLLSHEISKSQSTMHHIRKDSSERVISSSQRLLPDNTQPSQQTDRHPCPRLDSNSQPQKAASSVHYTTNCKHSLVLLRMSEIIARNMLNWLKSSINRYCCV